MKKWQVISIIALFVASIGLSATASHADEIEDLKKRLKFLEAQKEIEKKLDDMQTTIVGLRGEIDSFQKQIDDFRVQYNLKASNIDVSNKTETTKATQSNSKKNIYTYTWSANVCDAVDARLKVMINTKKLDIKVTNLYSGKNWVDGIVLKNGKHSFRLDINVDGYIMEFSGYALPRDGSASLYYSTENCDGAASLVPVKN